MIKFMYNGIKQDGKLHRVYYTLSSTPTLPEGTITIFAKDYYPPLPRVEGLNVENNSDSMTDYFEKDTIRVSPTSKYYSQVLEAYNKNQARKDREPYTPPIVEPVPTEQLATTLNVIELSPNEPATPKQLWALHCITKLDTRDWMLTKREASVLIGKAKKGSNILQYVGQIERAAR